MLTASALAKADDIGVLEGRLRDSILARRSRSTDATEYLRTLQADGTWPDIPYAETSRTSWKPIAHLDRILGMAKAWAKMEDRDKSRAELAQGLARAISGWATKKPRCSNWWYNDIAAPQKLGEALLLVHSVLPEKEKAEALAVVAQADQGRKNTGTNTGANRVDRAYATILRGVASRNEALIRESFLAIGDTMTPTTAEGIQPDLSYHQHGAQLYIRGYGLVFTEGVSRYGSLGAGTPYNFSTEQVRSFVDFLVDGLPWFVRGDSIDATAAGRGITRRGNADTISGYPAQIEKVLSFNNGYRTEELKTLQRRFATASSSHSADPALALSGNRYFPYSDVMEHHRPAFSISVKTASNRTVVPETGNGEGLKNYHLADGVTLIQRTGNEYDEIMPAWDWHRLPGTTTEQAGYSLEADGGWSGRGDGTDTGGVSDGTYGVSCFYYVRRHVSARKSWFFFDREMVALGAGIEAPEAKSPVVTAVNQCLQSGPVTYRTKTGGTRTQPNGTATPPDLLWVHHDGTGYFFPAPAGNATLRATRQSGSWKSLNEGGDATPVNLDVFSLDLDHGRACTRGTYAYIVAPGISAREMDDFPQREPVRILSNTPAIQAVKHDGLGITSAIFWTDSPTQVGGISCDKKACVIVRDLSGRELDISISDPTQRNTGTIILTLGIPIREVASADQGITIEKGSKDVVLEDQCKPIAWKVLPCQTDSLKGHNRITADGSASSTADRPSQSTSAAMCRTTRSHCVARIRFQQWSPLEHHHDRKRTACPFSNHRTVPTAERPSDLAPR
ncbi:MAG: polysaccharide lyase family 8 super-sandwich domain-containing protein [Luteolibacter sp.]